MVPAYDAKPTKSGGVDAHQVWQRDSVIGHLRFVDDEWLWNPLEVMGKIPMRTNRLADAKAKLRKMFGRSVNHGRGERG